MVREDRIRIRDSEVSERVAIEKKREREECHGNDEYFRVGLVDSGWCIYVS